MFSECRPKHSLPKESKPRRKDLSPIMAKKQCMIPFKSLPRPNKEMEKIIEEDVYRTHSSSSDDEKDNDYDFRERSNKMVQIMVDDNFDDDRIISLNKCMLKNNFESGLLNWR